MSYKISRDSEPTPQVGDNPQENWERNTLRAVLLESYKERQRARTWRNFWRCVWALLMVSFIASIIGSCSPKKEGKGIVGTRGEHTAVIKLDGIISSHYRDQVAMLRDGLEAAYANSNVKGIIIRANSPGGSPVVSSSAFNEIRRLKAEHKNIPVYVVAEDVCASGCYYIAAAADKIYADPSSIVGSIGVISGSFDFTGLMDKLGVKRRLHTAGSNKGFGDPFSPETPEQKAILEKMLQEIHQQFISAVKTGRGERLKEKDFPEIFSARVYTGSEAKKIGLIDDFGSVYSVSRDVIRAPKLVDYTPDEDFNLLLSRHLGSEIAGKIEQTIDQIW
ncbi:S49 family peptidase [Neisseria wadsworthii]|uniref:Protease n=1 Tax=Neisseria wadsworthii 9715 TaxID=1030841 RepID=G4CTE6_9NEIS|nr:S49 family peptidase [Neisseria wadsworthii]EGZ44191.1 protease [Neisseria wadsworthii 9715]QMT35934.1 S49 family peptidase [Neisseria wadsworthii]